MPIRSMMLRYLQRIKSESRLLLIEPLNLPPNKTHFTTKEVIALTGVTKDALRYYEKIAILTDIPRDQNNYRQYSVDNLKQLQLILGFKKLGLDLSLLASLIDLTDNTQKLGILIACQKAVHDEMDRLKSIDGILTQQISRISK